MRGRGRERDETESEELRRRYHLWCHPRDLSRLLVEVIAEERRVRQTLPLALLVPRQEFFDKRDELRALQHRHPDSSHLLRGQRSRHWRLERGQLLRQRIRTSRGKCFCRGYVTSLLRDRFGALWGVESQEYRGRTSSRKLLGPLVPLLVLHVPLGMLRAQVQ